jgi:hypothetical protein
MQLLEIIGYGPNTFGADERSGGNSERHYRNFPLKTQKFTQNALTGSAHRPGQKGRKKQTKTPRPRFFAEKTVFLRKSCVFACLGGRARMLLCTLAVIGARGRQISFAAFFDENGVVFGGIWFFSKKGFRTSLFCIMSWWSF